MCSYLWVVHKPHQASYLGVQDEVTTQELAAALVLLDVKEAADAVLSVHVRHRSSETFPGLRRPGEGQGGGTIPARRNERKERSSTHGVAGVFGYLELWRWRWDHVTPTTALPLCVHIDIAHSHPLPVLSGTSSAPPWRTWRTLLTLRLVQEVISPGPRRDARRDGADLKPWAPRGPRTHHHCCPAAA